MIAISRSKMIKGMDALRRPWAKHRPLTPAPMIRTGWLGVEGDIEGDWWIMMRQEDEVTDMYED